MTTITAAIIRRDRVSSKQFELDQSLFNAFG